MILLKIKLYIIIEIKKWYITYLTINDFFW